uniref:DUF6531 domain-containing protein n=1 Tax=Candidatus Kentrum sp. TC TaxID=2126339 RepID=A0A451AD23_9GAMM|nr:MAG: hypothetical protein BECKTC1821F_GA0114240_110810 [Candidatus Kentron sp. TC]
MYHDETDITIRGRGLDYTLTRTYNSAPVKPDTIGKPFGFGWTHSYNMRLIANDYGEHPNFDVSQAPENANGATSSITYVDERDGEINYLVDDQNGGLANGEKVRPGLFHLRNRKSVISRFLTFSMAFMPLKMATHPCIAHSAVKMQFYRTVRPSRRPRVTSTPLPWIRRRRVGIL